VVEDFADITTPLKQYVEAVVAPEHTPQREERAEEKARTLAQHAQRCARTGQMLASAGPCKSKKTVEALGDAAQQVCFKSDIKIAAFLYNFSVFLHEKNCF